MNETKLLSSIKEYEDEAKKVLSSELVNYIWSGAESGTTLKRNIAAFSMYALRRRVLHGVKDVDASFSYFEGKIKSDMPFFPSCINVAPLYSKALRDILRVSESIHTPIFVSQIAILPPLELSTLPSLVPGTSPLVWQIYLEKNNVDLTLKQAKLAKQWGYGGVALTVDVELPMKLRYSSPKELGEHDFVQVIPKDIKMLRKATDLPLIVKGVMTFEDAELSMENGADGIVVSNHGGRILDQGEASLVALSDIVRRMKSKKRTRKAEIFMDGGIRNGTDILKALALGARGCLIGRPIFWGLAVDHENGVARVMEILRSELVSASVLCGVSKLSKVDRSILARAS